MIFSRRVPVAVYPPANAAARAIAQRATLRDAALLCTISSAIMALALHHCIADNTIEVTRFFSLALAVVLF
jgi:hypothetical protein